MSKMPCMCDLVNVGGKPMEHYHDNTTVLIDMVNKEQEESDGDKVEG